MLGAGIFDEAQSNFGATPSDYGDAGAVRHSSLGRREIVSEGVIGRLVGTIPLYSEGTSRCQNRISVRSPGKSAWRVQVWRTICPRGTLDTGVYIFGGRALPAHPGDDSSRLVCRSGLQIKLCPFTQKEPATETERAVMIDPAVAFGRPVLAGTRVPTAILADRFNAGDALKELADDYRTTSQAIEEALRCELDRREAA
jgi:uncharacterized protein (DUF433 family)